MKAFSIVLIAGLICGALVQSALAAEAVTYKEKVLWSFGSGTDGRSPYANLIDVNGVLYGTTVGGGSAGCGGSGCGTVFSLDPNTGVEKLVYSFCGRKDCRDGEFPEAGLIDLNGTLYGTTESGGRNMSCSGYGCGTVFALDPNTGAEKVRYSFCTYPICADGADPVAGLIAVNGMLYGTTLNGGTGNIFDSGGTVFQLDPAKRAEKVLYSFCSQTNCKDGEFPYDGPIALNGLLYGTTVGGGPYGCHQYTSACGTVFSVDPSTGAEAVVHNFGATEDGQSPLAGLLAVNDILYGTTAYGSGGGTHCGCGTVFSLDPATKAESVLYSFCSQQNCLDGASPQASVIDVTGTLYGTTSEGGDMGCAGHGCGTVFAIDLSTGAETVLHSFCGQYNCATCGQQNCTDGANPNGSLIALNDNLYGTTESGGAYGYGTVYVVSEFR